MCVLCCHFVSGKMCPGWNGGKIHRQLNKYNYHAERNWISFPPLCRIYPVYLNLHVLLTTTQGRRVSNLADKKHTHRKTQNGLVKGGSREDEEKCEILQNFKVQLYYKYISLRKYFKGEIQYFWKSLFNTPFPKCVRAVILLKLYILRNLHKLLEMVI